MRTTDVLPDLNDLVVPPAMVWVMKRWRFCKTGATIQALTAIASLFDATGSVTVSYEQLNTLAELIGVSGPAFQRVLGDLIVHDEEDRLLIEDCGPDRVRYTAIGWGTSP